MADLSKKVKDTVKAEGRRASKDPRIAEVLETIDQLKRSGVIQKKSYRFPPPDTIGRHMTGGYANRLA